MRGLSGIRTLLIVALLFTMLSVVNSFELFNETSDFGFLMENKINVQVEQIVPTTVEGVVSVFSDNLEPVEAATFYNDTVDPYIGDEMETITRSHINNLEITAINNLRGDWLHLCSLYQQISLS